MKQNIEDRDYEENNLLEYLPRHMWGGDVKKVIEENDLYRGNPNALTTLEYRSPIYRPEERTMPSYVMRFLLEKSQRTATDFGANLMRRLMQYQNSTSHLQEKESYLEPLSHSLRFPHRRDDMPPMAMPETGTVSVGAPGNDGKPVSSATPSSAGGVESGATETSPTYNHKTTDGEENVVKRFDEGVQTAFNQIELSWDYLMKNVEKFFTKDPAKRQSLDYKLYEIGQKYAAIPKTLGAATVGNIGTNIVAGALPVAIAGVVGGTSGAAVAGGAMAFTDIANTIASANLEMDGYESATGEKLSGATRSAYVISSVASGLIMDAIMVLPFMKKLTPSLRKEVNKQLQQAIFNNPVSQREFNVMTQQVLRNELPYWNKVLMGNALESGVGGGLSAGLQEASRSIYTREAPELSQIVTSTLTGVAVGATQGTLGTAAKRYNLSQERAGSDETFYVSNQFRKSSTGQEIAELRPTAIEQSDSGETYVKGHIVNPGGDIEAEQVFPIENVSVGSYRGAQESGATNVTWKDLYKIPDERIKMYNDKWNEARIKYDDEAGREEAYAAQSDIVQGIAQEMGIPVTVYAKLEDLPKELQNNPEVLNSYAVTVDDDEILLVLDQCQGLTADNIAAVLRHEAIGHYGLPKLYADNADYNKVIYDLGKKILKSKKPTMVFDDNNVARRQHIMEVVEEYISRNAEPRPYNVTHLQHNPYDLVYDMLVRSDKNLLNMTMNEKRKRARMAGKPMPRLLGNSPYFD